MAGRRRSAMPVFSNRLAARHTHRPNHPRLRRRRPVPLRPVPRPQLRGPRAKNASFVSRVQSPPSSSPAGTSPSAWAARGSCRRARYAARRSCKCSKRTWRSDPAKSVRFGGLCFSFSFKCRNSCSQSGLTPPRGAVWRRRFAIPKVTGNLPSLGFVAFLTDKTAFPGMCSAFRAEPKAMWYCSHNLPNCRQ